MKTQRITLDAQGEPEVMKLAEVDLSPPGPGEIQIDQAAIGVNFMDIYQRDGYYPLKLPSPLGLEGAGTVLACGSDVREFSVGDRIAYAGALGAYATRRNLPAARAVILPDSVSEEVAAAILMKGMTVEYLLNRVRQIGPGDTVLFYAASGGVGQLAGQWGKHLGARMIGVTSGAENCRQALDMGYDVAIDRTGEDIAARVLAVTDGAGVAVAYDSIGAATFDTTIACLATYGLFVSFGATTGEAPPVPPSTLQHNGSLFFTRPTLADYAKSRADVVQSAAEVFRLLEAGILSVNINQQWPLDEAAAAHHALESGTTTGSIILTP